MLIHRVGRIKVATIQIQTTLTLKRPFGAILAHHLLGNFFTFNFLQCFYFLRILLTILVYFVCRVYVFMYFLYMCNAVLPFGVIKE